MKECRRCSSSFIRTEYDRYGEHELCLNCGWTDNGITKGRRIHVNKVIPCPDDAGCQNAKHYGIVVSKN